MSSTLNVTNPGVSGSCVSCGVADIASKNFISSSTSASISSICISCKSCPIPCWRRFGPFTLRPASDLLICGNSTCSSLEKIKHQPWGNKGPRTQVVVPQFLLLSPPRGCAEVDVERVPTTEQEQTTRDWTKIEEHQKGVLEDREGQLCRLLEMTK